MTPRNKKPCNLWAMWSFLGAEIPEPELDGQAPEPLFDSNDDFATASRRLIKYKALEFFE
jgi:hypothetical protein